MKAWLRWFFGPPLRIATWEYRNDRTEVKRIGLPVSRFLLCAAWAIGILYFVLVFLLLLIDLVLWRVRV